MSAPIPGRKYIDPHQCIWIDASDQMHIDAPKLMAALNIPKTPEGKRMFDEAMMEFAKELGITMRILEDL